jgi:hypothetical protein
MKIIYNILIISILCVSNALSQDSLKNKSSEEGDTFSIAGNAVIRNQAQTRQLLKEFSKQDAHIAFNYSNRYRYDNSEDNPIEKKKTITKSFTVDTKDKLSINNQHGEVKVELWNKNEIKVDITITGYGNSEKKAQELLDNRQKRRRENLFQNPH